MALEASFDDGEAGEEGDLILDNAIEYVVSGGRYAAGLSRERKRAVRKRATNLLVDKGEVYLKRKNRQVKVITDVKEQQRIIKSCHSDPTSGHFGMTKTWRRAAERFYWRGMSKQAKELVKYCPQCQKINKKITTERPELHPVPVKSPWYHLGMDFVGPISPASQAGNQYILTVSDYFTKFAWAKALPSKEAVQVVAALRELFLVMGLPSVITTDQGREFHNEVNSELMNILGIQHRMTTAYHPQANGLDERLNQTLINSISKFVQDNRDTWDTNVLEVVYAYNTAHQESIKHTPFEVMFGRKGRLPVDFNTERSYDADVKLEEFLHGESDDSFEGRVTKHRKLEKDVKENITKAQEKQKKYYDSKHGATCCFNVGSVVLKRDFRRKKRKGGKMEYRWQGPYEITASLGKGLFKLKELNSDKVVQRVNGFHLKTYYQQQNNMEEKLDNVSYCHSASNDLDRTSSHTPLMTSLDKNGNNVFPQMESVHFPDDSIPSLPSPIVLRPLSRTPLISVPMIPEPEPPQRLPRSLKPQTVPQPKPRTIPPQPKPRTIPPQPKPRTIPPQPKPRTTPSPKTHVNNFKRPQLSSQHSSYQTLWQLAAEPCQAMEKYYVSDICKHEVSVAFLDETDLLSSEIAYSTMICVKKAADIPAFFPDGLVTSPIKKCSEQSPTTISCNLLNEAMCAPDTCEVKAKTLNTNENRAQHERHNAVKDLAFKRRQKGVKRANSDVIDVDALPSPKTESPIKQSQLWTGSLTRRDKNILKNGDWLNDQLINAGQCLIKKAYNLQIGLQDVSLAHCLSFDVMHGQQFIQVLNTGKFHWVTISTIGCKANEVDIFDSMPPALTSTLQTYIATLLCAKAKSIIVRYRQCQQQEGSSDCGLFALAFASVLASGGHPSETNFDQKLLRNHLQECICLGVFKAFPLKRSGRRNDRLIRFQKNINIYCYCRMPTSFSKEMILCSVCGDWFHLDICVPKLNSELAKWLCSNCVSVKN